MENNEDKRLYWPKPKIFKFLRIVRKHPQLWHPKHEYYHNAYQRDLAYDQVSFEMGTTNIIVKKKIHTLRSQYLSEVRKMKKTRTETVWPYFSATKFFFDPQSAEDADDDSIDGVNGDDELSWSTFAETSDNLKDEEQHKWRQSRTLRLIETYRKYPELYNSNCFDYRNKYKRSLAFEKVAKEMGTTVSVIKTKMHNLRSNYISEMKKIKMGTKKSRWAFFDALKSLYEEAQLKPRTTYSYPIEVTDNSEATTFSEIVEFEIDKDAENEMNEADYFDIEDGKKSSVSDDNYCKKINDEDSSPASKRLRLSEDVNSTATTWNQGKTFELIEFYKKYPELYDSKNVDYRNQQKRKLAYKNLAKQINTTVDDIKTKLHTLRSCYVKELKKMKVDNSKQTKWVFFEALRQLYAGVNFKRRTTYCPSNLSIIEINEQETEGNDEVNEEQCIEICERKSDNLMTAEQKKSEDVICFSVCKPKDEFATFGETVATELRLTKNHEAIHNLLKQQILKALSEAKASIETCIE